jgi:serine/threonine-protein kinase
MFPGLEVLAELGRGASGIVYKAKELRIGRVVAIKALLRADSREAWEQFLREARVLGALTKSPDPAIPSIYAIAKSQGQPFHIREFVDGDTLEHRVTAGTIDVRSALRSLSVVASAVARVHELGLAHGNLYPSNVLVAADGTTKLIGFGRISARQQLPGTCDVDSLRELVRWLCSSLQPKVELGVESAIVRTRFQTATDLRTRLDQYIDELI